MATKAKAAWAVKTFSEMNEPAQRLVRELYAVRPNGVVALRAEWAKHTAYTAKLLRWEALAIQDVVRALPDDWTG